VNHRFTHRLILTFQRANSLRQPFRNFGFDPFTFPSANNAAARQFSKSPSNSNPNSGCAWINFSNNLVTHAPPGVISNLL
jgi:hypothetical protein